MSRKVVLTVGAVLRGDDAAGPFLAKLLQEDPVDGWEVVDGGQTPEDEMAVVRRMNPDVLLVVDAAQMGEEPGTVKVVDEECVARDFLITTHSLPLSFLLGELRACCQNVVFLGIQPAHMEFMGALTPQVEHAVRRIHSWLKTGGDFGASETSQQVV